MTGHTHKSHLAFLVAALLAVPNIAMAFGTHAIAASTWTQSNEDDFKNGTLDMVNISGLGDLAQISLPMNGSWREMLPKTHPSARDYHGLAKVYNDDKFVLYGGFLASGVDRTETWVYDLSDNNWTKKSPATNPGERHGGGFDSAYNDDKFVLFGGYDSTGYPVDTTWVYDLSDNKWTKMNPKNYPAARGQFKMSAFSTDDKFLIFGGNIGEDSVGTWIYDLSDNNWTKMYPKNHMPNWREQYSMGTIYTDDKVILFGGLEQGQWIYHKDTWIYDLSDNNWTKMSPAENPGTSQYTAMTGVVGDDKAVWLGGNRTWVYDLSEDRWTQLSLVTKPKWRLMTSIQCVYNETKVLLFGGYITQEDEVDDETWIFDMKGCEPYGNFTSAKNDTGGRSDFHNISWTADLPAGTSIGLQVRTGVNATDLASKNFTGPEGNASLFYNSSGAPLWSGHSGDRWVQYRAQLFSNRSRVTPVLNDVTIQYNRLPEVSDLVYPPEGMLTSNNTPVFKWNFSDADSAGQRSFIWQMDNSSVFGSIDFESGEVFSKVSEYQYPRPLKDGYWYWRVMVNDTDGGWSNFSARRVIRIDTSPPLGFTPAASPANWTSNRSPTIAFSTLDNTSGIDHYEIEIDNKSVSSTVENSYVLPAQDEGIHTVTVRAVDGVGHFSQGIVNVYIDYTPPSPFDIGWASGNWSNEPRPTIRFETRDETSGVDHYIVYLGARELGKQVSPFSLPTLSDGIRPVKVRAVDRAGNTYDANATIRTDVTPPVDIRISQTPEGWSNNETPTISFTASDEASGILNFSMKIDDADLGEATSPATLPPQTEGIHNVTLVAYDNAGNKAQNSTSIYIDLTPPNIIRLSINNDLKITNSSSVELAIEANDDLSGISAMAFSNDDGQYTGWEQFKTTKSWNVSSGNGKKTVSLKVKDNAGNVATAKAEIYFTPVTHIGRIEVIPASATVRTGENFNFSSRVYDDSGNELADFPVTWSVAGNIGTVDENGRFHAGNLAGSGKIIALSMGESSSANITVSRNRPPNAGTLEVSPVEQHINETVHFAAKGWNDPDNDTMEFFFDFGDGGNSNWSSSPEADHTYAVGMVYQARYRIRDRFGAESGWSPPLALNVQTNQTGVGPVKEPPVNNTTSPDKDFFQGNNIIIFAAIPIIGILLITGIWLQIKKGKRSGQQ